MAGRVLFEEVISEVKEPVRIMGESEGSTFQIERMAEARTLSGTECACSRNGIANQVAEVEGTGQSGWCKRATEINGARSFMTLCVNKREFGLHFKYNGQKAIRRCEAGN